MYPFAYVPISLMKQEDQQNVSLLQRQTLEEEAKINNRPVLGQWSPAGSQQYHCSNLNWTPPPSKLNFKQRSEINPWVCNLFLMS